MDEPVAVRDAVRNAVRNNRDVTGVTLGATPPRARRAPTRKCDTLRYLRAGAIWTALPVRDQRLLPVAEGHDSAARIEQELDVPFHGHTCAFSAPGDPMEQLAGLSRAQGHCAPLLMPR